VAPPYRAIDNVAYIDNGTTSARSTSTKLIHAIDNVDQVDNGNDSGKVTVDDNVV